MQSIPHGEAPVSSCTPPPGVAPPHLSAGSPLVDAGETGGADVDGSAADQEIYGGAGGSSWDLDADGVSDWFWPGGLEDAPQGFDPAAYDADDLDPGVP